MNISRTAIDNILRSVEGHMMRKYGVDNAQKELSPLRWYIDTGRASTEFIRRLLNAKPFMLGRKLHSASGTYGTYEDIIRYIKRYINAE